MTTVTVERVGTRQECEAALRMIPTEGAWDFTAKRVVHGNLVGKPKYARHEDHWHVKQEMQPK